MQRSFIICCIAAVVFAAWRTDAGESATLERHSTLPCGRPQNPPSKGFRIVGGGLAQNNSWPWACALVQEVTRPGQGMTYRQFCDCTLIDHEWVLTAAHCLENLTPAQFKYYVKVYVGVEDLTKAMYNSSKKYSVAQLIKHENFVMKTKHSDIALIKLDRAVATIDNDTMPACLPSRYVGAGKYEQVGSYERKVCYVGGWGHTREGETAKQGYVGSGTDKLKQTSAEIMAQVDCRKKLPVTDTMFCAGYDQGGRDTCQGDSGGPLVCDDGNGTYVLHGIVSWGPGCARPGSPGVYTNVNYMKAWIEKNTNVNFVNGTDGDLANSPDDDIMTTDGTSKSTTPPPPPV